jgi:hypothetical protein
LVQNDEILANKERRAAGDDKLPRHTLFISLALDTERDTPHSVNEHIPLIDKLGCMKCP